MGFLTQAIQAHFLGLQRTCGWCPLWIRHIKLFRQEVIYLFLFYLLGEFLATISLIFQAPSLPKIQAVLDLDLLPYGSNEEE